MEKKKTSFPHLERHHDKNMDDRHSADCLREDVYQYLVEEYDKYAKDKTTIVQLIVVIIVSAVFFVVNPLVFFVGLPFLLILIYQEVILRISTVTHLKHKTFTYHIGRITKKETEIKPGRNDDDLPDVQSYLYVDGEKYDRWHWLQCPDDYALADTGDLYIVVYAGKRVAFCTRVQEAIMEGAG